MGEHVVDESYDEEQHRAFTRALLDDVRALEILIREGRVETGVRRIGAEQELFLVDETFRPANLAVRLLERLDDSRWTTELGLFNIEANLDPLELTGSCLSLLEQDLDGLLADLRQAARAEGGRVALTGILPTLDKSHLGMDSMTPNPRYHELARIIRELRGGDFQTYIKGLDELQTRHDNVMLESCNTSFQLHFQVTPDEFSRLYNLAQFVTGPLLAVASNSPVLLRRRLWHETRVALFQQSVETRSDVHAERGGYSRVSFGNRWIDDGVLEIFREDIARFRVIMTAELEESPLQVLGRGEIPRLKALCIHNGTVYRWNRPCYGVADGLAHLRIENRVLPAGPTVVDEVANAAFYLGLMCGLGDEIEDITRVASFEEAKNNFTAAARFGIEANLRWIDGRSHSVSDLVIHELLPRARQGLKDRGLDSADIDRYLGVIEARVSVGRNGSQWILRSLAQMGEQGTAEERYRVVTEAMVENAEHGAPVHTWELASLPGEQSVSRHSFRTVGQIMKTDLFTMHPGDLVDLAASLMDWKHIRHVPVENSDGRLVGLVSHRQLLRLLGQGLRGETATPAMRDIMTPDPVTVSPEARTIEAVKIMRRHHVSCLPVVSEDRLVGIITERDLIEVAARLLDAWLDE